MSRILTTPVSISAFLSALVFAVVSFVPAIVAAQDLDNVTLTGKVADQNGAIIPGATLEAILIATNSSRTTVTDDQGRYRVIQLDPGIYTLRVSAAGFATQEKKELTFIAGKNVQLEWVLAPEGVKVDPVTVTSDETPLVDTTRTVVGGTVTTHEVESLPVNSRSPLDLIFTLPGVSEEALSTRDLAEDRNTSPNNTPEEAGTFSLSGGPAYSNNITIDGLDNNDDRAARERFQPSLEAVEEVQVITNQFSAEYGRASGGRINIRTRGGSTKYRGRAFFFYRNDFFNANTSNNKARGLSRLPFEDRNPGITFGGPVRLPFYDGRKKTYFFSAYEYDTILDSAVIDTLVPITPNPLFAIPPPTVTDPALIGSLRLAAGIAPFIEGVSTPVRNHTMTTRLDHRFSELHNGSFLYQLGRQKNLRQFGGGNRLAEALLGKTRNTDAISYTDNFVFSPTLVNQARLQFSRLTPAVTASGGRRPVVLITIDDPLPSADPEFRSGTLVAGSSTSGATDRRESRVQGQEILSWVRGAHSLKFGADVQYIKSTFIDLSDISGTYSFANALDFNASTPSRFRQNFQAESLQKNYYTGFFIQDEWRMLPNLVFSFGLRYENESIVKDRNNWGPRVSVAYDPFKNGKSVIRFGAGIFYNRALLRTIDDFTLGAKQQFFDTNDIINPATGLVGSADFHRAFIAANIRFPETFTVDSPLIRSFGNLNAGFSRRLDPNLRIPESYQANVGFERDLGKGFVFESNYTFNRGLHLWREFNVNAPRLPAGFHSFSEYLGSRDFVNFRSSPFGIRPLYNVSTAGDLVRFVFRPTDPANPNAITRIVEAGVPISVFNLNSFTSSTAVEVALASLNAFRPDPTRTEVEQLISSGNSFYHGVTFELRKRLKKYNGFGISFRSGYTWSHMTDDGIVNTSDALTPGNFFGERSRSLLDRTHRFVFSGTFDTPAYLGKLRFAPVLRLTSGAPFNISIGGNDRNLDDVGNDRPIFTGDTKLLKWRQPADPLDPSILSLFALPTIGQTGDLPRNAGRGPGQFFLDFNVTREFKVGDHMKLRPVVEFDNVLNKNVFSFGSEFIDFSAFAPTATPEQRRAFLDSFLVTTRTLRPRQVRFGVRFDF
ncbi:MAG TPA: carboxypeptidase regulatory-like domain-containing protein [Pyrinomonadaceae bacterium]|nr:carboxypeptidase regulatory-like domain-containing protein [Pyrinomonadaceae bacterium]